MCEEKIKIRCTTVDGEKFMHINDVRKYLNVLRDDFQERRNMAGAYVIMQIKDELGNLL